MMKKLLLSSVIVLASFTIVSAQTSKSIYGSKAQNNVPATSQTPEKATVQKKQNKTEAEQKAANKKEAAAKAATKPKSVMSLVEAQKAL
jgi:hypothetical protein